MIFGFEVYNQEEELVTDSNFAGYSLITEDTIFMPANTAIAQRYDFGSPITSKDPPIVAVFLGRLGNAWITTVRVMGEPYNWTHCLFVQRFGRPSTSNTYRFRVYATGVQSSDSFGLRIINASGDITLDSGFKQLEFNQSTSANIQSWPQTLASADYFNNVIETRKGFRSPLYIGDGAWLPLSLVSMSFTTTHSSPVGTQLTEVQASWVNHGGYLTLYIIFYAVYGVNIYSVFFNTFCPVIID